jgi:CBS-domain-containing membrane protein
MNIPIETKPALWGIVGGAALAAFVGFQWGGWVTGGTSELRAKQRADAAVVTALAPMCVERFRGAPEVAANLTALKKADAWAQGEFVEKGGWATLPGPSAGEQVSQVARACAVLLAA